MSKFPNVSLRPFYHACASGAGIAQLDVARRVSYNLAGAIVAARAFLLLEVVEFCCKKFFSVVHILIIIVQAITALALIVLMAVQNDKNEQGGVMGIGGAGGRDAGEIDMEVGLDRILIPLTRWMAGGFIASSVLAAIPEVKLNFAYLLIGIVLYVVAMLYGGLLWQTATGMKKS